MHCALAALLDEDPEGCFLRGGERGETFQSYHAAVEDDPDFITIISKLVALCAAPAYFAAGLFCISRFHNFHSCLMFATISQDSRVCIAK
jgi:hypothetical protein